MRFHPENGLWEIFIPKATLGSLYKYELLDAKRYLAFESRPLCVRFQLRPDTASQVSVLPDTVPMTEARKSQWT